ncbi:unnamed protein product [Miscanthus lutarioriparius]|uniref:Uncharacterized protein n=1 Tax=Miscanthus lutarioriparius TaxID=422564 RepID=A0A811NCV0_9POAL|nr:unnamed protein product [Miscanthus lutarioriparius]
MLGFFLSNDTAPKRMPRFVPTTSAPALFQPPPFDYNRMWTLDCRHGRVLCRAPRNADKLLVWDPITGDCQRLPWNQIAVYHQSSSAVLCAVSSCNHHDCHRGPFLVVSVGSGFLRLNGRLRWPHEDVGVCVLFQDWGMGGTNLSGHRNGDVVCTNTKTGILIGDELYFNIAEEAGTFALDLRSGLKKRITELVTEFTIFPFMSFYTPDCATRKLQLPADKLITVKLQY